MPFAYTSGDPNNLTSAAPARMQDIQGPFFDISAWLNSSTGGGAAAGGYINAGAGPGAPVLDVGQLGQLRAGRQLANLDFTSMGLAVPLGLWNLGDLTDVSGNARALINKGAVPFGVGINGLSSTAAVFAGSTGQALYIADTGAADPFRIKTGSWGCWFRTAKRGVGQALVAKMGTSAGYVFFLSIAANVVRQDVYLADSPASNYTTVTGVSDVADDRWHFVVCTHDGSAVRVYVDGILEGTGSLAGPLQNVAAPFNIGAYGADGATAATAPHYGRVDEAFVTADVLSDDQVRLLYCTKIAHTLGAAPVRVRLAVRRQRKGAALATTDFPATPVRLHNVTAGALTDQGTGGVTLTNNNPTLILAVAGADGSLGNAFSFSGAHTGLSSTDAGLPTTTAAHTYGAWIKTTTLANQVFLGWGTTPSAHTQLWTQASGLITQSNGGDQINGSFAADGQWHHVVVVEDNAAGDGVRRKVYMDGRLVGTSTVLNSLTLAGANKFRVGTDPGGAGPFTGQVDGAFVYAGALTMEQVVALYARGAQTLAPSPKNPGDHVEAMDATSVYATFDTLDSQQQVDLAVAA